MSQQPSLRPADVAVALRLAGEPGEGYEALSGALAISLGAAHNSVGRLEQAGLLVPESRAVDRRSLIEFLVHGARFAFYPVIGPEGRGVPTAHAAPPLSDDIVGDTAFVWPSARGSARGTTLTPLYAGAPETVETAPEVYRALALVDALRVGRVRERRLAREHLERLLGVSLAGDESP